MSTKIDINPSNALSKATPKADGLTQRASSKRLAGKIGVITGGSTGMGQATAKRFVQEGMDHVFITGNWHHSEMWTRNSLISTSMSM